MIPPRNILVPTDFSEPAQAALDYSVELAEKLGASIHIVHAFELPPVGLPHGNLAFTSDMADLIVKDAEKALTDLVKKYDGRKVVISTSFVQADPREGILMAAKKVDADLVVMGTHGRRGIARALIGSTTESVVRTASLPVLTVHGTNGATKP